MTLRKKTKNNSVRYSNKMRLCRVNKLEIFKKGEIVNQTREGKMLPILNSHKIIKNHKKITGEGFRMTK